MKTVTYAKQTLKLPVMKWCSRTYLSTTSRFIAILHTGLSSRTYCRWNQSITSAMHSHNPVIAHNNKYNRWVAGEGAMYFNTEDDLDQLLTTFLSSLRNKRKWPKQVNSDFKSSSHMSILWAHSEICSKEKLIRTTIINAFFESYESA